MVRLRPNVLALAALAVVAAPSFAGTGLSTERFGLGLKPPGSPTPWTGGLAHGSDPNLDWQSAASGDVFYGGTREFTRLRLRAPETYAGIFHPLAEDWGASLELGVMQGQFAPRRYSLTGQLHTALAGGSTMSFGLKYRVYEPEATAHPYADPVGNGYALVPPARIPGVGYGPTYQLSLNYQYSPAHVFGLALGRDLETFTPGFDVPGGARQFTFTAEHWLTPSWALSYDVLSNDPGNSLRLQGLRLGVRYRF
jgi:hypothetical protein